MASKPKTAAAKSAGADITADLDELDSLLHRAEHFENAGQILKLRLDGRAIIARIRAAL